MQVPYRSMLPKGVKGLLVAGRSHGAGKVAHAATRNMACCAVMGQGAGIAAALSLKSNQEVDTMNLAPVHKELDRQGVRIH